MNVNNKFVSGQTLKHKSVLGKLCVVSIIFNTFDSMVSYFCRDMSGNIRVYEEFELFYDKEEVK